MRTVILKVVEGKGKTGNAKNGKKRFLFEGNSINLFNSFVAEFANEYKQKFPRGKQTYKTLRAQFIDLILKYQDKEIMDYEIKSLNTVLRVGNITAFSRNLPFADIDKTLNSFNTALTEN